MKLQKIFKPIGRSSKKGQKHRTRMKNRASIMRHNQPIQQQIAHSIVSKICQEISINKVISEKHIFCKTNRRWYLLDIFIPNLKLCIEIDGDSHTKSLSYDKERDNALLKSKNIKTIRFKNKEVETLEFTNKIRNIINGY